MSPQTVPPRITRQIALQVAGRKLSFVMLQTVSFYKGSVSIETIMALSAMKSSAYCEVISPSASFKVRKKALWLAFDTAFYQTPQSA